MTPVFAGEFVVRTKKAPVFARPHVKAKVVKYLKKGDRIFSDGVRENGFYSFETDSGETVYILPYHVLRAGRLRAKKKDPEKSQESSREAGRKKESFTPLAGVRGLTAPLEGGGRKFSFDLGLSIGSSGDRSFWEFVFGANYLFAPWFNWRNAFFYHGEDERNFYGLDTGPRVTGVVSLGETSSLAGMGGAGYRLASKGGSAPFLEAGVGLSFAVRVGISVKVVLNSLIEDGRDNQAIYSLILAGSF